MSCENCERALEILEEAQQKLREVAKALKSKPENVSSYDPPCLDLYEDRLLLKVTEAGKLRGMSRATSYQMLNGEWGRIAIRLSERSIRIPMRALVEQKEAS